MQIETSRFGIIEVSEDKLINFPWGIPGFEELKHYVMVEHKEGPFQWLQAVDDPTIAFAVCPPELLGVTYTIADESKKPIEVQRDEDLLVLNLVSFKRGKDIIRFHMRSPILFNTASRVGCQLVMNPEEVQKCVKLPAGLEWVDEDDEQ